MKAISPECSTVWIFIIFITYYKSCLVLCVMYCKHLDVICKDIGLVNKYYYYAPLICIVVVSSLAAAAIHQPEQGRANYNKLY